MKEKDNKKIKIKQEIGEKKLKEGGISSISIEPEITLSNNTKTDHNQENIQFKYNYHIESKVYIYCPYNRTYTKFQNYNIDCICKLIKTYQPQNYYIVQIDNDNLLYEKILKMQFKQESHIIHKMFDLKLDYSFSPFQDSLFFNMSILTDFFYDSIEKYLIQIFFHNHGIYIINKDSCQYIHKILMENFIFNFIENKDFFKKSIKDKKKKNKSTKILINDFKLKKIIENFQEIEIPKSPKGHNKENSCTSRHQRASNAHNNLKNKRIVKRKTSSFKDYGPQKIANNTMIFNKNPINKSQSICENNKLNSLKENQNIKENYLNEMNLKQDVIVNNDIIKKSHHNDHSCRDEISEGRKNDVFTHIEGKKKGDEKFQKIDYKNNETNLNEINSNRDKYFCKDKSDKFFTFKANNLSNFKIFSKIKYDNSLNSNNNQNINSGSYKNISNKSKMNSADNDICNNSDNKNFDQEYLNECKHDNNYLIGLEIKKINRNSPFIRESPNNKYVFENHNYDDNGFFDDKENKRDINCFDAILNKEDNLNKYENLKLGEENKQFLDNSCNSSSLSCDRINVFEDRHNNMTNNFKQNKRNSYNISNKKNNDIQNDENRKEKDFIFKVDQKSKDGLVESPTNIVSHHRNNFNQSYLFENKLQNKNKNNNPFDQVEYEEKVQDSSYIKTSKSNYVINRFERRNKYQKEKLPDFNNPFDIENNMFSKLRKHSVKLHNKLRLNFNLDKYYRKENELNKGQQNFNDTKYISNVGSNRKSTITLEKDYKKFRNRLLYEIFINNERELDKINNKTNFSSHSKGLENELITPINNFNKNEILNINTLSIKDTKSIKDHTPSFNNKDEEINYFYEISENIENENILYTAKNQTIANLKTNYQDIVPITNKPYKGNKQPRERFINRKINKKFFQRINFSTDQLIYYLFVFSLEKLEEFTESLVKETDSLKGIYLELSEKERKDFFRRIHCMEVSMHIIFQEAKIKKKFFKFAKNQFRVYNKLSNDFYFKNNFSFFLELMISKITQIELTFETLENFLKMIKENYHIIIEDKTEKENVKLNNVMKILTILTTIYAPMNIIPGLFGMNIKVPGVSTEVENLVPFISICLSLLLLIIVQMFAFKKLKWF